MKKILLTLTLLLGFSFSVYAIENKTQYGQWWVYNYINNFNDKKLLEYIKHIQIMLEIYNQYKY